jgi:hypothetical protein
MPIAETSALERIARVLAAERMSVNAEGYSSSASIEVDNEWPLYLGQAAAILRTLREPDLTMANAGDAASWRAMVEAALNELDVDLAPD